MTTNNVWQQAIELTDRVLKVTSGLNLPRGNYWFTVVTVFLSQTNEMLNSIRMLLNNNCLDSSVILTRSLFEFAVNLAYISKDTNKRLPEYLKHGRIPLTNEEARQLQQELEQKKSQDARDFVPRRAWRSPQDMCCGLGSQWLDEYEMFYRYASVPTHAGSFTLGKNYLRLLQRQTPTDLEKAEVLVTALEFQLRIALVASDVFPQQLELNIVKKLWNECQKLGQFLVKKVI